MESPAPLELEPKIMNALKWIVGILARHKIPYQITGGLAARLYGGTRPVHDVDLDIPEDRYAEILEELSPYISFGPTLHTDENWKVQLLTLNYEGQDIDLGGAYQTQIFDPGSQQWVDSPADLEHVHTVNIGGLELLVVKAEDLIHYKNLLQRDVDIADIQVVRAWVNARLK